MMISLSNGFIFGYRYWIFGNAPQRGGKGAPGSTVWQGMQVRPSGWAGGCSLQKAINSNQALRHPLWA
ncbi:MAG: hypothetical protein JST47_09745 [Bacteroidetes bacterium]|nr:hypothetical protein [Bacteroidota bacterium]MBS1973725.1 hypothetical protein [Bacteroidota bacterium]